MRKLYYIAIQNGSDVEYIYRPTAPRIGETIYRNGKRYTVIGFMEA